eukprot:NODE_4133_length_1223_cov_34.479091_g3637_i0.p1 GENE.NODE_4133_length_1223_cov_34.479091_g3637_i0~~NODE_4133_length_1223_cov_34.479091_g3637_i0.p1  ORF type:complete len:270 (+),score=32.25 NODE_4133_length_1223_cov_34.479091_g3637_i0:59-868(+)
MSNIYLPGEILPPPPAKLKGEQIQLSDYNGEIKVVVKSQEVNIDEYRRKHHKCRAIVFIMLLAVVWFLFFQPTPDKEQQNQVDIIFTSHKPSKRELKFTDPLKDLSSTFRSIGVEPSSETSCIPCFFNDTSRVCRSQSTDESFLAYRIDPGQSFFEVITHVYNPDNVEVATSYAQFRTFTFYTANNEQDWAPLIPSYERVGSSMGWEKGLFRGEIGTGEFFKIQLNEPKYMEFSPQIGEVSIYGGSVLLDSPSSSSSEEENQPEPVIFI